MNTFVLEYLFAGFANVKIYLRLRKVRHIIRVELLAVELSGITLGHQEWLCHAALLVNGGKIKVGEHSVLTFRREHKPVRVLRPVVIAVGIIAIRFRQRTAFTRFQVHHPQVGICVKYGEIATAADTVHQPAPVIGGAYQRIAAIVLWTI